MDHHQVYLSVPNVVNKGKNLLILHSDKQLSTKNKNAGCINHGLYENSSIRLKMSGKPTNPFDQIFSITKEFLFLPKWLQLVDYDFLFLPGDNNRVEPWVL